MNNLSKGNFFKIWTRNLPLTQLLYTGVLLLLFSFLSGCNNKVNPSFHYAFIGTSVIMVIALFVATAVTRGGDKHGPKDNDKKPLK